MKNIFKSCSLTAIGFVSAICVASAAEVSQLEHGTWQGDMQLNSGQMSIPQNFWIDIQVENIGYDKSVFVVWTSDEWRTANVADAWYEGELGNGKEKWGVDIVPVVSVTDTGVDIVWTDSYSAYYRNLPPACGSYIQGDSCSEVAYVMVEYAVGLKDILDGSQFWDNNNGENYQITIDNTDAIEQIRETYVRLPE